MELPEILNCLDENASNKGSTITTHFSFKAKNLFLNAKRFLTKLVFVAAIINQG